VKTPRAAEVANVAAPGDGRSPVLVSNETIEHEQTLCPCHHPAFCNDTPFQA